MDKKVKRSKILIYALPNIITASLYLICFFPGLMSTDSLSQWEQVQSLILDDWHPVAHTLFNYLITRLWNNPAAIAIVQILIISLIIGYGFYSIEKIGANKVMLSLISILFSLYPANGLMGISLWKDIDYSAMLALLTILLINIFFSRGSWLDKKHNIIIFIITCLGVMFFRHNGILSFIVTMIFLFVFYSKYRKKIFVITIVLFVSYIVVKGPIYNAIGVIPAAETEVYGIPMQQIAAVVKHNGYITEYEKNFINNILPYEKWGINYNKYSSNPLKFDDNFDGTFLTSNRAEFLKNWISICAQNPAIAFRAYTDQTSLVWRFGYREADYTYIVTWNIPENKYNLKTKNIFPKMTNIIHLIYDNTQRQKVKWLFWKPALELYIALILGAACFIRLGKKIILILMPLLSNAAGFLLATPAQDYRYLYSTVLIAAVIVPLFITVVTDKSEYMT